MNRFLATCTCLLLLLPAGAQDPGLLKNTKRIVFLGDSNTFAGGFIAYLDTYLVTRFPEHKFELLNLGLPSETVSGLSEADHPYPRPDVHTRLDKALAMTKPDLVIACYGMNDGIYSPFSEERFTKYKAGIERLMDKVKKSGAKIVLMTPAPFDPVPVKKNLLGKDAPKHSWLKPYDDYDGVLRKYSAWLLTLRGKGVVVADPHTAIHQYLAFIRKTEPNATVSGDGIHPNATGHGLIFIELWKTLQLPGEVDRLGNTAKDLGPGSKIATTIHHEIKDWHAKVLMPLDKQWDRRWLAQDKVGRQMNRLVFGVLGQAADRWALSVGEKQLGTFSQEELKQGIELSPQLMSQEPTAAKLAELVHKRQKMLGLAWLTHVGHQRPDTPKGALLAEALKHAEDLDRQISLLNRPQSIRIRVERLKKP